MDTLNIFADVVMDAAVLQSLKNGIAPHKLILPQKVAASVLAKSESDPALQDADIVFGQPDAQALAAATHVRWAHLSSAGYTRYDTPEFRRKAVERGLILTNSSSVYDEPCAEHVFAFMLANARQLPVALKTQCANSSAAWAQLRNGCSLLREQRVVILGYGAIASCLIELLRPFRMQIVALRRMPKGNEAVPIVTLNQLPEYLAQADHVIDILPENAGSIHFASAKLFAMMKPGATFYNIGRGATVDQTALLSALKTGHLSAAWLDVTTPEPLPADHPLLAAPNCFITPHIAGGHHNEAQTLVDHFLDNFRRFVGNEPLRDRVI